MRPRESGRGDGGIEVHGEKGVGIIFQLLVAISWKLVCTPPKKPLYFVAL